MTTVLNVIDDIKTELQTVSATLLILDSDPPANIPVSRNVASVNPSNIRAFGEGSGLAVTSCSGIATVTLWKNKTIKSVGEAVDDQLLALADSVFVAFHGDLVNTSHDWYVDVLGEAGTSLGWRSGYMPGNGALYRVIEIEIPFIINDIYTQVR